MENEWLVTGWYTQRHRTRATIVADIRLHSIGSAVLMHTPTIHHLATVTGNKEHCGRLLWAHGYCGLIIQHLETMS